MAKEPKQPKKKNKMSQTKLHGLTYEMISQSVWLLVAAILVFVVIIGTGYAYEFGYAVFSNKDRDVQSSQVTINVLENSSVMTVGKQLEAAGIIDSANVFLVQSKLFKLEVKPGTYTFDMRDSSRKLLEMFNAGPQT